MAMENQLNIHSIFSATEGEGIFLGRPQVFVRFQGCNIGCVNCDSMETWSFEINQGLSVSEVVEKVESYKLKNVSITGGDPLHPKHVPGVLALARKLKSLGYYINIEASGQRVVDEIFDIVDFISFDYKTPSTGVKTSLKNLERMAIQYKNKFQVKAVISDKTDFYDTLRSFDSLGELNRGINWALTPAYCAGEDFPRERFLEVIDLNMKSGGHFRVIGQQHKWLHGPDKRDV